MNKILIVGVFASLFYITFTAPQQTDVNEQLEITDPVTTTPDVHHETPKVIEDNIITEPTKTLSKDIVADENLSVRVYRFISEPILKVIRTPKVNLVLRNIGICLVNGAMEIFTFYLPPPMLPLVASAAGLIIPFEPVVMLKEKMPVTSYRRAFKTAMDSFLGTFDQYKNEDDYDPYMTQKFNRRFMNDDTKNKH